MKLEILPSVSSLNNEHVSHLPRESKEINIMKRS